MKSFVWYLGYLALVAFVCFVAADVIGGLVFHIGDREASRTYQPVFVSGHFYNSLKSLNALAEKSGEGPLDAGYRSQGSFYAYEPKKEIQSPSERFNWLFRNEFTRYSLKSMQKIEKEIPGAVRIFVIGGSTALGTFASGPNKVWHALLEQKLRKHFQYQDIYIFSAAVAAYVTFQERLAFEFALLPRKPDVVIDLNGVNDIHLPITRGCRPGDPYQTGARYAEFYNNHVFQSLIRHSNLLRQFRDQVLVKKAINQYTTNILADANLSKLLVDSIVNVYCRNMKQLMKRCRQESIECLIFLQPWRDLARHHVGLEIKVDKKLFQFMLSAHENIVASLENGRGPDQESFVDLSHVFSSKEAIGHFADLCHVYDKGQEIIADAVFSSVSEAVARVIEKKSKSRRPRRNGRERAKNYDRQPSALFAPSYVLGNVPGTFSSNNATYVPLKSM